MMKNRYKAIILMCVCLMFLLVSCAENKYSGRAIGGTAGAAGGAILGKQIGGTRGAIIGAIIGSALGFGIGWLADDYNAKQIKSAQQARQEEIRKHGKLPQKPRLNGYNIAVKPANAIKRGKPATIVSTIDLCPWQSQAKADVREESIFILPNKNTKKIVTNYSEINEGGVYEFRRSVDTKGIPGGAYGYKSTLYVNNIKVASRNSSFKIAAYGNFIVAAAE